MPKLRRLVASALLCAGFACLSACAVSWDGSKDPPPPGAGLPGQPLFDAVAVDGERVQPSSSLSFARTAEFLATLERSGLYAPGSGVGRTLDVNVSTQFSDVASIHSYITLTALPGFAWTTATVTGFVAQEGRLLYEGGVYRADTTEMLWLPLILWPPSLFRAANDAEHASWKRQNRADASLRALESLLAELELRRGEIELATVEADPGK